AEPGLADRAVRAVAIAIALRDAADVGADLALRAFEVAAAGRSSGGLDLAAPETVAIEATGVVAIVSVGRARGADGQSQGGECEAQMGVAHVGPRVTELAAHLPRSMPPRKAGVSPTTPSFSWASFGVSGRRSRSEV